MQDMVARHAKHAHTPMKNRGLPQIWRSSCRYGFEAEPPFGRPAQALNVKLSACVRPDGNHSGQILTIHTSCAKFTIRQTACDRIFSGYGALPGSDSNGTAFSCGAHIHNKPAKLQMPRTMVQTICRTWFGRTSYVMRWASCQDSDGMRV